MARARVRAPAQAPVIRWLVRPTDHVHGCGAVEINGAWYFVGACYADPFALPPVLTGYEFVHQGTGDRYGVDLQYLECSCPDHLYRRRKCKHLLAIEEILS